MCMQSVVVHARAPFRIASVEIGSSRGLESNPRLLAQRQLNSAGTAAGDESNGSKNSRNGVLAMNIVQCDVPESANRRGNLACAMELPQRRPLVQRTTAERH